MFGSGSPGHPVPASYWLGIKHVPLLSWDREQDSAGFFGLKKTTTQKWEKLLFRVTQGCCSCRTGTYGALPASAASPALAGDAPGSHGTENRWVKMHLLGFGVFFS